MSLPKILSIPGGLRQMLDLKLPNKTGKPPIVWPASKQRELVRLVEIGVPWKDIAIAIEDKATGFTPKHGNCRKQWNEIAKMNPSELQISDPIKKRHKIDQAIEAFKAYKRGPTQTQAEFDQPPSHNQEPMNTKFDGSANGLISPTAIWTPNASMEPPLSYVATPADSIAEMHTPASDNLFAISSDKSDYIARSSITPRSAQSPAHVTIPDTMRKRPVPSDCDPNVPSTSRKKSYFRLNRSTRPEESLAQAIDSDFMTDVRHDLDFMTDVRHDLRADTYSGRKKKKKGNKGKLSTIAEVEDKMMVPRDFLGYIKRLTINRFSAVSALSSSGPPWSRRSTQNQSDFVQPGQEAGHNLPIRQPSSKDQPEHEWRQVSFPKTVDGRPHTDLFRVLESGEYSEEEIGDKLEALIAKGADPNICNRNGETPLHVALTLGNSFACEVLLDGGADVHVKTLGGKSLTEYGRDAEKRLGEDVKRYVAIKACRKLIFEYDPREKRTKASKSSVKIDNDSLERMDDDISSGSQGGPSGMRATPAFNLGEGELRQATPTREASLSHVEDAIKVAPGHNSSFTNFSYRYTIGNLGALRSTVSDIMQDLGGNRDIPAPSVPDQTINPPPRQTSPVVRDLVGFWERSHSTNPSSVSQSMQSTDLDGGRNEGSLSVQSSNAPQSFKDPIPHTINTGLTTIHRHRRAPNVLDIRNLPTDTQQGPHALGNEPGNSLQSFPCPKPPAQLAGYLQLLPTGQWALVCPLSTDDAWRYAEQEGDINCFSPAVIQIVAPPEIRLVPSMTVPQLYNASNGGPSTLAAAQEEALSQTTMPALPTWSHVEPLVQPNPATIPSDPVQNARPTTISPSNARGVSSLNNAFLDAWEHMRPGIPPRI